MSLRTIYFVAFMDLFNISLVIPSLITASISLQASLLLNSAVESVCYGLAFISAPIAGSWSDNIGRKRALLCVLLIIIVNNFILAYSFNSIILFILARIIDSTFHHIQVLLKAVVMDIVPKKDQFSVFNIMNAINASAFIVGPIIGSHLYALHGNFVYIVVINNFLYLLCLGTVATLEEKAKKLYKKKRSGVIENIKQVKWNAFWDIFLFKFCLEIAFFMWRLGFRFLSKEVFQVPAHFIGYVISTMSVTGITTHFAMPYIQRRFYSDDENGRCQIRQGILIQALTFLTIIFTSGFPSYLLCSVPFIFSKVLINTAWMKVLLKRTKNDKGIILGVSDGIAPLSGLVSPLIVGVVGALFGLSIVLFLPLIPLAAAVFLTNTLYKTKMS